MSVSSGKAKPSKKNAESVSDDDRSEKMLSSSHDEKDYKAVRVRRSRDWSEEERRRKKGNFKLEFEKDSMMKTSLTSPLIRQAGVIKKISPDDKAALNVLDGASPSKQKRFRPKTRKLPRNRTPNAGGGDESTLLRRHKAPMNKSPTEKPSGSVAPMPLSTCPIRHSPAKFMKPCMLLSSTSPLIHPKTTSVQRLKAISTESLRSVSPGSDSVFYSEADILEHQVSFALHC